MIGVRCIGLDGHSDGGVVQAPRGSWSARLGRGHHLRPVDRPFPRYRSRRSGLDVTAMGFVCRNLRLLSGIAKCWLGVPPAT